MRRRDFIKGIIRSAVVWPLAARAQQEHRVRRIGVLMGDFPENAPEGQAVAAAFREELQKLGWTEGRNIRIDYRSQLQQGFATGEMGIRAPFARHQS